MAEEKQIRIYHTHIEVYPYQLGECETIEKQMSVWVEAEFRYEPISYFVYNDTYKFCIPYNNDTKHLIGTTDEAPEYYRYWED